MEVELKLSLAARFLTRAIQHPGVERAAVEPPHRSRLLSIYYDTPKHDLCAAGVALRIRRAPAGWIQTVKWGGFALGGLHQRGEHEIPLPAQQLDLDAIDHPDLVAIFAPMRLRKRLKPVFVTEFERASRTLRIADSSIELSCDRGEIVAGTAREPISELELELTAGDPRTLFELAAQMQSQLPLRPMDLSKAARGYILAGQPESPAKAAHIQLDRDMSIAHSAVRVVAAGLCQLQANERGMLLGRDPEYLHQLRVALRRLRSTLGVYSEALAGDTMDALRRELRWVGARLGVARDWDVFQLELLPPLRRERSSDANLAVLARAAEAARERANRTARATVRSRRYARLLLALGRIVATADWGARESAGEHAVLPYAIKKLERRYAKVVKRGSGPRDQTVPDLHKLRIAIKKLRYAGEFFGALFPGTRTASFRLRLAELQDSLGSINDQANMQRLARSVMRRSARTVELLLAGWSARVVFEERRRFLQLWRQFRRARRFW